MKPVIGIDVDDTLASTISFFLGWYNRIHQGQIRKGDVRSYDIRDALNCTVDSERRLVSEFFGSNDAKRISPYKSSKDICSLLADSCSLVFITSRLTSQRYMTERWILDNYHLNISEVIVTNGYAALGNKRTKVEVARDKRVVVMIDDSPHVAKEFSDARIPMILIDQPWNQDINYKGVYRVGNWRKEDWWTNGLVEKVRELTR